MTGANLSRRIDKIENIPQVRLGIDAMSITRECMEEIHNQLDVEHRAGRDGLAFLNSLSETEYHRFKRDREAWVREQALRVTHEDTAKLEADGIPMSRWTDSELHAAILQSEGFINTQKGD